MDLGACGPEIALGACPEGKRLLPVAPAQGADSGPAAGFGFPPVGGNDQFRADLASVFENRQSGIFPPGEGHDAGRAAQFQIRAAGRGLGQHPPEGVVGQVAGQFAGTDLLRPEAGGLPPPSPPAAIDDLQRVQQHRLLREFIPEAEILQRRKGRADERRAPVVGFQIRLRPGRIDGQHPGPGLRQRQGKGQSGQTRTGDQNVNGFAVRPRHGPFIPPGRVSGGNRAPHR